MKQLNSTIRGLVRQGKRLCTLALITLSTASVAQTYTTQLSGPNEQPPNASPGSGSAVVTVAGTTMRLQTSFSGLQGNTTTAHIHAATAVAGVGTAGVATTVPVFPGFPLGVKSGSYDRTFDMTQASSYNPAFISANGGTPASAFTALKAAFNNGTAYLNIHSNVFPGGEIRGFLQSCPTISVTIPDAYALPQGTLANTVYPAYAPAASLSLQANATGGAAPYTYQWSNGATTATTIVSPVVNTSYTVSVTDKNGCPGSGSTTVNVADISGGKNGDKIMICHKDSRTLTIDFTGVADHLGHGDLLGSCGYTAKASLMGDTDAGQETSHLNVQVLRNPASNYFDLKLHATQATAIQVRVFDLQGRLVETILSTQPNSRLRVGAGYRPGTYIAEVTQGRERRVLQLRKQ